MKPLIHIIMLITAFSCAEITMNGYSQSLNQNENENTEVLIVYDNYAFNKNLGTNWGFGCVIRTPTDVILFDTGGDRSLHLSNMEKMEIDPQDIDIIVLSHNHHDHVGGLEGFLQVNSDVIVHIPVTFPNSIREMVKSHGAEIHDISGSEQISDVAYTTGVMGTQIKEQSLVLDTPKGVVVITGCAHPGIIEITKKAKEIMPNKEIYLITGGFHLLQTPDDRLKEIISDIRKLGVKYVAPSHCSGDRCRELFQKEYKQHYIDTGVGKIFNF